MADTRLVSVQRHPASRASDLRRLGVLAVLAWSLVACEALTTLRDPALIEQGPTTPHGDPIDAGPRPSDADCEQRIRSQVVAAARIRAAIFGHPFPDPAPVPNELQSDLPTVEAVAKDPKSHIDQSLGIPLTNTEEKVLDDSHVSGWETPLAMWVGAGAPERFGGFWIAAPETERYVVAIPSGDPDTLALARCLETNGVDVRYVHAVQSLAEGRASQERVSSDRGLLAAIGIDVMSIGYLENEGVLEVGIKDPTDAKEIVLMARYGPFIRVIEGQTIVAL